LFSPEREKSLASGAVVTLSQFAVLSGFAAEAIQKFLGSTGRCKVIFSRAVDETERRPEFAVHGYRRVAYHIEAAAASGTFRSEARDDHVAFGSNCVSHLIDVTLPVLRLRQKMKDCAVMPDVVRPFGQLCIEYIRCYPFHSIRPVAEPLPGNRERCGSDVENSKVSISGVEKSVDESRCSAADIDYRTVVPGGDSLDEMEGNARLGLIPAHLHRVARFVHSFPVTLVHRPGEY
jgi:hypothetical protein